MVPTLYDGDVVLVRWSAPARENDVVLVRWGSRPGQLSVKRASHEVEGGWFVRSDNPLGHTTDSHDLGAAEVVARVVCRLWPRPKVRL
ncbi:S24 family peptidase [Lentzea tibetensis]|uniref:S24 family peptidase n=2 Tax=Lentzea tibetensis TaxID=2591470 RepID=A0A563F0C3_9PSEU|nr:S24 family peptidase [Lentzea tibetensis]